MDVTVNLTPPLLLVLHRSGEHGEFMAKSLSTLVLGFVVALAATVAPTAAQTVAYPTLPGTSVRDYSMPGIRIK